MKYIKQPSIFLLIIAFACSCNVARKFNFNNRPVAINKDSIFVNRKFSFSNNDTSKIKIGFIDHRTDNIEIGRFEKLEIGLTLPEEIDQLVDEFLNNKNSTYLNPYDPDHINIEASFYNKKDTITGWGFYYKDYFRDKASNRSWKDKYTDYNWRIRFAPPDTGRWNCTIRIVFPNSTFDTLFKKNIQFNCIEGKKDGFIAIGDDKRHFKYAHNNESFFAIGQNIAWTDEAIFKGKWANGNSSEFYFENKDFTNRLFHVGYEDLNGFVKNAAENKGNMIRILSWHDSYLFEWEERGVYGSNRTENDQNFIRQKRSWELDQLFRTAEESDIKLLFCVEFPGQYSYDWNNGDKHSFYYNPYNKVEKDGKIDAKLPTEFFEDRTLINDYKKKLRYFIARWGYSPSLGVLQLLNEFDGWSTDSTKTESEIRDVIMKDIDLQINTRNWHDEIGQYIHQIADRPMIVTSGLMISTKPTDIPFNRNFFNTKGMDMVTWNYYGNDRSVNYLMSISSQSILRKFDKPFLFTETGIITNPEKNADPSDLESCDDVMFHNFLWAGSAMGTPGTSLEWWQNFDNNRRKNFKALNAFYSTVDFNSNMYTETDRWNDGGTATYLCGNLKRLLKKNSLIEVYYVRSSKKNKNELQQAYGWTHNLSYYWANLSSYMNCPDRHNHMPYSKNCSEDEYTEPVVLNSTYTIQLKGLKPKKFYTVEWYATRGDGGKISTLQGQTNGSGMLKINWPGSDFDYAFKISELAVDTLEKK